MSHPKTDKQCSLFMLHFIVLYHFTLSYSFNTRVSITTAERYELCIYMYGVEEEEEEEEEDDLCDLSLLLRVSREVNSIIYQFAIILPCLICCPLALCFLPSSLFNAFWQLSLLSPVLPLLAHLETLLPASLLCCFPSHTACVHV